MSGWPRIGGVTALVRACHPEPTLAVTFLSGALAASSGRDARGVVAVVAAVLTGQLSVGWCNDYVDRDRDLRTGRQDKPLARGDLPAAVVGVAALGALLVCVPLSLLSGWQAGSLHVLAVLSAWAYDLGLKATSLSVLPYAVSFGLLPAFIVLGRPGAHTVPAWLVAGGSLLGAGAHFANALPDLDDDVRTGVRGLPHRLGPARSRWAAALLLLAASAVLAIGPAGPPGVAGLAAPVVAVVVLTLGLVLGRRGGSRAAFRAVLVVAVIDVVLLLIRGPALG
ncbi:MAG: UbiA family prenyltransferase [Actinomycetota bacterium]|nr:UbiA family prenyltransferase [Actinomycetota bacterium]